MQKFKLDIFKKETGNEFTAFKRLSSNGSQYIMNTIQEAIGLPIEPKTLFGELAEYLPFKDFTEHGATYDIELLLNKVGFSRQEPIFIIWSRNEIDKIQPSELLKNWGYIWYDTSDEAIILYQRKKQKILLITDYGRVFYM